MSNSHVELFNMAETIYKSSTSEIEFRTVVNRSYYAAFHHARIFHDALPSVGNAPTHPVGVHEKLIQQLLNPSFSKSSNENVYNLSKSIGYILKNIKKLRTSADYHLDLQVTKTNADTALIQSKSILDKPIAPK